MPPATVAAPVIAQLTAAQPLMNFPPFGMPPPGFQQMPPWGNWPPTAHPPMFPDPKKPEIVDPAILTKAAEWSEHKAPDGRPYFYHSIRGESVWEKPAALVALDGKYQDCLNGYDMYLLKIFRNLLV
jgi:transcription elongation regulator 1